MCRRVSSGPETETVSAEDAARNLANVRERGTQALEDQQNRDLAEALDQLHGAASLTSSSPSPTKCQRAG